MRTSQRRSQTRLVSRRGWGARRGALTIAQVSSYLGVPSRSLKAMALEGLFPATCIGTRWLISPENLERWLDERISMAEQRVLGRTLGKTARCMELGKEGF